MEKERRLIDANKAQAVLVNMAEHLMEAGNPEMAGAVGYAAEVIGKQKTVDAVEVVRCKDCFADGCCSVQIDLEMGGEGYCPKGKRRTDNG